MLFEDEASRGAESRRRFGAVVCVCRERGFAREKSAARREAMKRKQRARRFGFNLSESSGKIESGGVSALQGEARASANVL